MAVIAGHMHRGLKGGGRRRWYIQKNDTHYINTARVPRIFEASGQTIHHYVCLEFNEKGIQVNEREIPL